MILQSPWGRAEYVNALGSLFNHAASFLVAKKLSQQIPSLDDFPQVVIPSLDRYCCSNVTVVMVTTVS